MSPNNKNNQAIINLNHLSKVYGTGELAVNAVNDISLHISKGEMVAIMGPSGSGKTTLLQMIGALLKPTSGAILVKGKNIAALPEKELPRIRLETFGFIFQTPNLMSSLTALKNVELVMDLAGRRDDNSRKKAVELLEQFGLGNRLDYRPSRLSGGEQQRIAIARALANDPSIVLADEPTANLDSRNGHTVMELLRNISRERGKTVVVVSHDTRIRDMVDRVVWLEDGRISLRWTNGATVDPVCLMAVEKDQTAPSVKYAEDQYYFCSAECRDEFLLNPKKYLKDKAPL